MPTTQSHEPQLHTTRIPEYVSPAPNRRHQVAMKAGGVLLGLGTDAAPRDVLHELVVTVGGFHPKEEKPLFDTDAVPAVRYSILKRSHVLCTLDLMRPG